jgi:hypothetical protein
MTKLYDRWRHPDHYNDSPKRLETQLFLERSPFDR